MQRTTPPAGAVYLMATLKASLKRRGAREELNRLLPRARAGDPVAAHTVGEHCRDGIAGASCDPIAATAWFRWQQTWATREGTVGIRVELVDGSGHRIDGLDWTVRAVEVQAIRAP